MKKRILSIVLSIVMLVSLLPTTAWAAETHDHSGWQEWNNSSSLPTSGSYYLMKDVNWSSVDNITINSTLNLCLNGHSITFSSGFINVSTNGHLNISDCGSGGEIKSTTAYPICNDSDSGTITVSSGKVTGASNGIYNKKGTVIVSGGTVSGDTYYGIESDSGYVYVNGGTVSGTGSTSSYGIYNSSNSSVTVSGGSITGDYGGISNYGTVNISGGSVAGPNRGISNNSTGTVDISGGKVSSNIYGIYNSLGTVTVSGNAIISSTGDYGIYNGGTLELSGTPNISGVPADIYLIGIRKITISEGGLDSISPISVKKDSPGTFTTNWTTNMGSNAANYGSYFTSADSGYTVQSDGNGELKLAEKPTTYTVTYKANGATSGTVPTDGNSYTSGSTVTVLGNTGDLAKTGYAFAGWNTNSSGYGTDRAPGETFGITANTTLYAQWEEYDITTQPTESAPAVSTNADGDIVSYQWYKGTMSDVTDATAGVSAYTKDTLTSSYSGGWWTCHEAGGHSTPGYFTIALSAGDSILAQTSAVINEGQLGIWAAYANQDWDWTTPDDHFLVTAPADGNYDLHVSDVTYSGGTQPTVKAQVFHIGSTPADGATGKTLVAAEDGWYACKITYKDGTVLYSGPVEYESPVTLVTGISLNESSITLDVGGSTELTAYVSPDGATDKSVTWTSSDPNVATVVDGVVTAVAPGSTTITATANDGSGKSATCTVTVNKIAITGTIAITTTQEPTVGQTFDLNYIVIPTGNYSYTAKAIAPNASIEAGKNYILSVGLKPNDGYYFTDDVTATINGKDATVRRDGDNISITYTYSFASPAANSVDILMSGASADTASIPLPGINEADATMDFTAKVLDQYGQEMTGQTVEWSVTGTNTTGISVNNGTVTVSKDAAIGDYTLTATCGEKPDNITIQVKKVESVLTTVKIFDGGGAGNEITTVDRTIPNVGSKSYINSVAKGYDQYGEVMTELSFTWSNTNTDPEISLVNGYVTISSGAQEGSFSYTASCSGKSAIVTVNLTKKMFTVTYTDNVANETVFSDVQLSVQSGGKAPAYPNATPTRTSYIFAGWYTSTDGGTTLSAAAYDFDTPVTGNLTLYAKWTEKESVNIAEAVQNYTWNGEARAFVITGTPNAGFAVQYKVNDNWTDTVPSAVGTYDVKVTRAEDGTYKAYEKEITDGLVIKAATPTATAPTAKTGHVYDGNAQALIETGTSEHGHWEYSLDGTSYSSAVPTGTDAKTYTVSCKFVPNEGYDGTELLTLSVTIAPMGVDEPTVVGSYTYTGSEQTVALDGVLDCMTVSGNKATDAGDYVVSISLDGNHKWNAESDGKVAWSIGAKTVVPTAALEYASIVYSGSERKPAVTLKDGDAEIPFVEYTVVYSNNVNVGTATVTITDKENGNYTFAEITKTFEIMRDGVSPVVTMDDYVYGGTPAVPSVSGNNDSSTVTVYYSTDSSRVDKLWEDISGTTLNVGTYYMKAHVAATDNYAEGVSPVITFKVTPGKYEAPSAPTASEFTVTVNEADRGKILEYSLDGANWINVPALTDGTFELKGLAESTQYTVYLRVKASADGNYQASDAVSTVWTTPARYSVAYHANLGTGNVPASVTQNSGRSVTVARGSGLKRTGYTFAGWNTAADGTGVDYAPGSTISTGATLYAKWTANSYTVKFKANGGSGTMGDQNFTYDIAQALTGNAFTRDGYHFAGWSLASGNKAIYMDGQTVKNLSDKGTVTLHAVWVEDVYKIGADFSSGSNHEIKAKLMRGDAQIGSTQSVTMSGNGAPYTGHFDFTGVPKGIYNIVAEQDGKVMTKLIIITDHDDTVEITMPASEVNSVLEVSEDALPVVVGGLEDEAVTKAEESKTVTITMTVEKQEEQQLPDNASESEKATQEAIAEIKEEASSKTFEFMDIEVKKTVEEDGQADINEKLTETNKVMEIVIPFDLTGKMDITVYRHHNGKTEQFAENTTKADGTFYIDETNHLIHVFSQKFSTYAIGYTEPTPYYPPVVSVHACTSKCEVCGGCEDAACTENACKDKCRLLSMNFTDVADGKWYTEAVEYVYHHKMMEGVGNNIFDINGTTTRAMIVTILWRLEGELVVNYLMQFDDIPAETWYTEAVRWAASEKIVEGWNGKFDPMGEITREQFATILWRYAKSKDYDVSVDEDTNILSYEDAFSVSEYAIPAMQWACGAGLMQGDGVNLTPKADATRTQAAALFQRFCEKAAEK